MTQNVMPGGKKVEFVDDPTNATLWITLSQAGLIRAQKPG